MSELVVQKVTLQQISANGSVGTVGQVLMSDGANTYWSPTSVIPTSPGGVSGQVQINNAGSLAGDANLTFNTATSTLGVNNLTVPGTITANTISANGSVGTAGQVLKSDGTISYWANDTVAVPAGINKEIQFNNNGAFGADTELYYDSGTNTLTAVNIDTTGTIFTKVISANGTVGTAGQALLSDGTNTYWGNVSAGAGAINANSQVTFANTITFSNTVSIGTFSANGATGTAGQVLTSNSTGGAYWSTITGVDANAQYSFANTIAFNNTITVGALSANGSVGTAGQILTSDGTKTYWQTATYLSANSQVSFGNTITFANTITVGSLSANGTTGTAGQVLKSDGTNTYWATDSATPAGSTTEIQFNDGGAFGANNKFTFDKATSTLSVPNYTSTGTITANVFSANGSTGTAGQVLTSDGTKVYWFSPSYFDANASVTFANTVTFSNTVTVGAITANGATGTAGQILTANSTGGSYWQTPTYLSANDSITFGNTITFSNTVTVGAISANGGVGTAGQVLLSNGTTTYWGTDNVAVYSITAGTGLNGGTITTTGTIDLKDTAVTANSYGSANTVATFTVDQQGRLTAAADAVISIDWAQISSGKPTTLSGFGITDGVKTVNGISPDGAGNVAVSLTGVSSGTLLAKPASANDGHVYVIAGDPTPANDGRTFIYSTGTSTWYEISGTGQAANDARYVNVTGDTMTGDLAVLGISANGTVGAAGEVLFTNGTTTYWSTIPAFDANNQITFANTISFSNTVTLNAVSANGTVGTAGQALLSNGTTTYWGTAGVDANSQYTFANTVSFTNTVSIGALSANGTVGTAGQHLVTNGTTAYWADDTSISANSQVTFGNTVTFSNTVSIGTFSANGATGTAGQVLTANSTGGAYWSSPLDGIANAQITFANTITFSNTVSIGALSANGTVGTAGQHLVTNGTTAYWADDNSISANSQVTFGNTITFGNTVTVGALSANGSVGTAGQVLLSDGSNTYWGTDNVGVYSITAGSGLTGGTITSTNTIAVDVDYAFSWTNTHSFSNTVTLKAVSANGTVGTAGQVLFSDGAAVYWGAAGGTGTVTSIIAGTGLTGGTITTSNTVAVDTDYDFTFANNITFSKNVVVKGVSANGSVGTAGDILVSNGTDVYWQTPSYLSANDSITFGNTVTFSNTVTLNAVSANGATGTAGQILTANSTGGTYWQSPTYISANDQISFGNTITFSNTVTVGALSANGSVGTAGQVLLSDGTKTYWGTDNVAVYSITAGAGLTGGVITTTNTIAVDVDAQFAWTNTHSFSNTITIGAVSANGGVGTAGQVLTSDGTKTYWATSSGAGLTYTNASSAPASPKLGDMWYDTDTDILYINSTDGGTTFWLDVSSAPSSFSNLTISDTVTLNAVSANGSIGTAGQALLSDGSKAYWGAAGGSKWTDVGSDIYRNSNVAIGSTTAPSTKLHVTGDATVTANLVVDTNTLYVDATNNRVGFGTASPSAAVDVAAGSAAQAVVAMAGIDMDLSLGQMFTKVATAGSYTFSNVPAGRGVVVVLHLTNGGAVAITWPASVKWPGGTAPTLTAAGTDVLTFVTHDGGTTWRGNVFGKDIK